MWWLVALLVLAFASFFVVKSLKESTERRQAEHDSQQRERLDASSRDLPASDNEGQAGGLAQTAGAVAATGAVAHAATRAGNDGAASEGSSANRAGVAETPSAAAGSASAALQQHATTLNTGDTLSDVREMIKILNLDGPDAGRLDISREALTALRKGQSTGIPDASALESVADRLRQMLA
ncbi:MAG: hypothetical protein AB8B97_18685 [Granulosicoccus sp.]